MYFLGEIEEADFDSQYGTYNDYSSCSIVLNGNAILFGGNFEPRQISVVYRNGIKIVNTLPFNFGEGRCLLSNGTAFLCFDNSLGHPNPRSLCRTRYIYSKKTVG